MLWAREPDAMSAATARLDEIVRASVEPHGGEVLKDRGEGDSHFVVCRRPSHAVHAACALVANVEAEPWPAELTLRVRVGLHVGEVVPVDGDLYGLAIGQTARIRGLGHGGQILASQPVVEMSEHLLGDGLTFRSLGIHRVRDFVRRQEIFQLCSDALPSGFPPLNVSDLSSSPLAAIAVIDVVGSSQFATAGHDAVVHLAQQWRDTISTAADAHNGANLKAVGDGCIATFRAPHDAIGFVRAVRERLQTNELQIRGSVHFGPVELVGDDIAGRSVYLAHELVRLASPGQILISPAAGDLLDAAGIPTRPAGSYAIPRHGLTWEASEA